MSVIAFEAANSYVKIKSANGEDVYPNAKRLVGYGEENPINSDNTPVYRIGSENYIVGEHKFNSISSSSRDVDRYASKDFKIESLIAIAKSLEHTERLTVVTGLPASHYRDHSAKQSILKALSGSHKVYVNDEARYFVVEKVHIVLQPYAAILSVICDEYGNIREGMEELTKTSNVVIDVGWGTTDVAVMDGVKLLDIERVDYSMLDAYKMIEKELRLDPELTSLNFTPFELEAQIRDKDTFTKGGGTYEVSEIKHKAFRDTANMIMRSIKNKIPLKEFDNVFFAGGGVAAMSKYLASQMESKNARRIKDPQMAIVRGLYNYGVLKS